MPPKQLPSRKAPAQGSSLLTLVVNQIFVAYKLLSRTSPRLRRSNSDYILCISAIAVSVLVLILASSIANGFRMAMETGLVSFTGHGTIKTYGSGQLEAPEEVAKVLASENDIRTFTPYIMEDAILERNNRFEYARTIGVDLAKYDDLVDFQNYLVKGAALSDSAISSRGRKLPSLLVGNGLAKALKLDVGDEVVLAALNKVTEENPTPMMVRFVVGGLYRIGIYEYDYSTCIIPLAASSQLFEIDGPQGFWVRTVNLASADSILAGVEERLGGYPYSVSDYRQNNAVLFRWIAFQNQISILALSLILIVAIGTCLTLLLTISLERWTELGVLRCLGASRLYLFGINTLQGLVIAVTGTLIGIGLGVITCWLVNHFSLIRIPGEVYIVNTVRAEMGLVQTLFLAGLTIVATVITSIVPALLSLRISPTELFRAGR